MILSSWFDFLIDEKLDTYFYLYVGYMYDYFTFVNDVGIKYLLMKQIGQENGVIPGFLKT